MCKLGRLTNLHHRSNGARILGQKFDSWSFQPLKTSCDSKETLATMDQTLAPTLSSTQGCDLRDLIVIFFGEILYGIAKATPFDLGVQVLRSRIGKGTWIIYGPCAESVI